MRDKSPKSILLLFSFSSSFHMFAKRSLNFFLEISLDAPILFRSAHPHWKLPATKVPSSVVNLKGLYSFQAATLVLCVSNANFISMFQMK